VIPTLYISLCLAKFLTREILFLASAGYVVVVLQVPSVVLANCGSHTIQANKPLRNDETC
jgi:hypothetical protein